MKSTEFLRYFLWIGLCFHFVGCASYPTKVQEAKSDLTSGNPEGAVEKLRPLAEKDSDDQLLYLLDYGIALQRAGRYKESVSIFIKADKLSEIQDYHSISRVAGSILLNEGMVQYKGDDYEKVLINAYLAIAFVMQNDLDGALVETRRLNEKLTKYRIDAKMDYEQNPFARYLSAIIWEADQKWDDAYISYEETYKIDPTIPLLPESLIYAAQKAQRPEALEKWRKQFPSVKVDPLYFKKDAGELIVIYQQGRGPQKRPNPDFVRVPRLYPSSSNAQQAQLNITGIGKFDSKFLFNLQDVAIKTLDSQYAGLIAKRVGGIAAKAVVADQIAQRDRTLGALAWIGMNLADQADLRQWSTLPQTVQMIRKPLLPGKYSFELIALNGSGQPTGERLATRTIEIKPRRKTFIDWRTFN